MSTSEQASYPIQKWEGAGQYIADELNKALDTSKKNAEKDSKDFEDSEFMKSWHDQNSWWNNNIAGHDNFYYARAFNENVANWTDKKKCEFAELPPLYRQYLTDLNNYQIKCWNELVACWNQDYLYQLNSPKVLWDKAELWKGVKTKEMDNLLTDIGKMQLQTSWTGAGATAYGNAIGVQTEAFNKITQLVQASSGGLNDGSSGLQRFYMSVAQCAIQMQTQLEQEPPGKEDSGWRIRRGIAVFKECKEYFKTELQQGIRTWSTQVGDGSKKLHDAIANERPFKGTQWPKIDGDLSDMKPGPSNSMGMPPTATTPPPPSTPDVDTDMPIAPDAYDMSDVQDTTYGNTDKLD